MKRIKSIIPLSVVGVLLAGATLAQEEATTEDAGSDMPAQVVTDGGVEAVYAAQEGAPAPADKKFKSAAKVLKEQAKAKKLREGWDDEKKRIIQIESADFKTADPATDTTFFIKRELAAKKAVLQAKTAIIQFINQDMSAMDRVDVPGSDLNKLFGAERERLNVQLARQKEAVAALLGKLNKAEAEALRGATFGDRLNDLLAAAIKKLDAEYNKNEHDEKAKAQYLELKQTFEAAQTQYDELAKKASAANAPVEERQESYVKSVAAMSLYGSSVILQTESWDKGSGMYQVAVMVCWSTVMERAARAIVTGENFALEPSETGKSIQDWLDAQDLSTMIGPRQYIDNNGQRWFLGVTARPYDDDMSSSQRSKNKNISELYAQQMAAFCLFADVESYKDARTIMETRGDEKVDVNIAAENAVQKLTQSFENKKIRGLQKLSGEAVAHPITGGEIYVAVYGINSSSAAVALEIEKVNYATKVLDNQHQTRERGRDAANKAAVKESENRAQDFQRGFGEQKNAVNAENAKREAAAKPQEAKGTRVIQKEVDAPKKAKQSTGGAFGGDADVNDNF